MRLRPCAHVCVIPTLVQARFKYRSTGNLARQQTLKMSEYVSLCSAGLRAEPTAELPREGNNANVPAGLGRTKACCMTS